MTRNKYRQSIRRAARTRMIERADRILRGFHPTGGWDPEERELRARKLADNLTCSGLNDFDSPPLCERRAKLDTIEQLREVGLA